MKIDKIKTLEITSVIRVVSTVSKRAGERHFYGKLLRSNELIYTLSGDNKVVFNNTQMHDKTGSIRFLPKGVYDSPYCVDVLSDGECIDIFFDTPDALPTNALSESFEKNANIASLFIKIHQIWSQKKTGYYNKCMSLFYLILSEIEISSTQYIPHSHISRLNNAIEFIHTHYCDANFQYEALPPLCKMGYTYFKKLFVKSYNMLPSEYVRNLRIKYACELLANDRFPVSQVAQMCGFNDISYFSRFFKQAVGISPSLYKKQ